MRNEVSRVRGQCRCCTVLLLITVYAIIVRVLIVDRYPRYIRRYISLLLFMIVHSDRIFVVRIFGDGQPSCDKWLGVPVPPCR